MGVELKNKYIFVIAMPQSVALLLFTCTGTLGELMGPHILISLCRVILELVIDI